MLFRQIKPVFLSLLLLMIPILSSAQPMPDPADSQWQEAKRQSINFHSHGRKYDYTVYLGFLVEYHNVNDPERFLIVLSRFTAFAAANQHISSNDETFSAEVVTAYSKHETDRLLNKFSLSSDPVIYITGLRKIDLEIGGYNQGGDIQIWFQNGQGDWLYTVVGENQKQFIRVEEVTEPALFRKGNMLVGVKYSINDKYHILRIHQKYIAYEERGGGK